MILMAIILWLIPAAWGHKVNVFASVEGDKVLVEGHYGKKTKAVDCAVEVLNADGEKLVEGKTDSKGTYSFSLNDLPPMRGELTIVLHATGGHKAQYTLRADQLPIYPLPLNKSTSQIQSETDQAKQSTPGQSQSAVGNLDAAQLQKLVEETIDAKLLPLIQMLSNQQKLLMEQRDKSPTFTEILGGIGWIFGLVGVAAYFMSLARIRKR